MQTKTIRCHLTLVRMAIIKKPTNNKCWRGYGEERTFLHCWCGYKLIHPLWKTVWRFLKKKTRNKLPYDPEIPLLGIYPEETIIEKTHCTLMFTAALFPVARTWKQPRRPLTDEWIGKEVMLHIYSGELLNYTEKHIRVSSNQVDEPRAYYTE